MINAAAAQSTEKAPKIIAAAQAEAARLCDRAHAAHAKYNATSAQIARGKRYQIEEFRIMGRPRERLSMVMYDMFGPDAWSSREELLAAIDCYCDAGIAEVERRFAQEIGS